MIRIDFDQPAYLRAIKGQAILSSRLQHLLPESDDQVGDAAVLKPVVINRMFNGAKQLTHLQPEAGEVIKGEYIPFENEAKNETAPKQSKGSVELSFSGVEGKSVTGPYGGSGYAHYRFNKKNGKSFFVRVGNHIIWGIELGPEIRRCGVERDQTIKITFMGKQEVTVLKEIDRNGKKEEEWLNTHKNLWKVEKVS